MGFSLSILSASNQKTLNDLTAYYSIDQYFNLILGVDNYIADGKIENGKKLMRKIGLDRNEIILIGDTDHDYDVAQSLKIDYILISHGHQSDERLKKFSNQVIANLNQLFS
jgi:phosphoglycolate phosphatase